MEKNDKCHVKFNKVLWLFQFLQGFDSAVVEEFNKWSEICGSKHMV